MKKTLYVILSAILVLVFASTGIVYAEQLTPLPVLSDNNFNTLVSEGHQLNSGSWWTLYAGSLSSNTGDVYAGAVPNPDVSGYYTYYVASMTDLQGVRYSNSASSATAATIRTQDSVTGVYYFLLTTNPNLPSANCPIFSTLDDFLLSVSNPVSGEVVNFILPAGYAYVIDGACDIINTSFYINNSWSFTTSGDYRVNGASQRIIPTASIRDGFSPDRNLDRSSLVQWEALNANIFGKASNYEFYSHDTGSVPSGASLVISYPNLYGFGTAQNNATVTYENAVDMVCSIYLMYTTRPTFRWVAIESLPEFTDNGVYQTYSVFRPEVADEEGVSSSGSGGTVITPENPLPSGGGNSGQPPVDDDSSLLGTISKFVNDIKRLLSSAVEAINTLVSQGSSFMQNIASMFTWLPDPVLAVIVSGCIILLVVGVLKTLWR